MTLGLTMLTAALDDGALERAAVAIYEFDENLTDQDAKQAGVQLSTPRISWRDLCKANPAVADGYRGRARAALLALLETGPLLDLKQTS